jgi:hypothetical protein
MVRVTYTERRRSRFHWSAFQARSRWESMMSMVIGQYLNRAGAGG